MSSSILQRVACITLPAAGLALAVVAAAAGGAPPPASAASGAALWAANCGHCHNLRSPESYSDAQWDVVALHMRVRANLTARERELILGFLRSAH